MQSVATALLDGFHLKPTYRPRGIEDVLVGLVCTLAKHKLLGTAIQEITNNTDLEFDGVLAPLTAIATTDNIPYLFRYPMAVQFLLEIRPILPTIDRSTIIDLPSWVPGYTDRRALIKTFRIVNELDIGFKLYLVPHSGIEKIGVLTYNDKRDLLQLVQQLKLPAPVRDLVL